MMRCRNYKGVLIQYAVIERIAEIGKLNHLKSNQHDRSNRIGRGKP
jgi:hypothetical protein